MTETSQLIIEVLETTTINHYLTVVLIPVVLGVYAFLVYMERYDIALGGLGFFLADVFNELANTILMFASDYAPLWGTPLKNSSGWLLLPGWC